MASDITTGPSTNETSFAYSYGGVTHNIITLARVSPDVLLVHQAKMTGFYIKVGESPEDVTPVPRDAKDLLLRSLG